MFLFVFISVNDAGQAFAVKAVGSVFYGDISIGILAIFPFRPDDADTAGCAVGSIGAVRTFFTDDEIITQL